MRRSRLLSVGLIALALDGCPCVPAKEAPGSAELLSQIRTGLAERERKLTGYQLAGTTTDIASGQQARFQFAYRAPDQMRGELLAPSHRVFTFDGKNLSELAPEVGVLTHWSLDALDRARGDTVLHQVFAPFAPEGFRAPLLPTGPSVKARGLEHPEGNTLELSADLVEDGQTFHFFFEFKPPAMDLVRDGASSPGGSHGLEVLKSQCDSVSGMCLPQSWVEKENGQEISRTMLTEIHLNPSVADGEFVLAVPDGGREETRTLVPSDGGAP